MIRDFGEATRRAIEAGFDGVELAGSRYAMKRRIWPKHDLVMVSSVWREDLPKASLKHCLCEAVNRSHRKQPACTE